MSRRFVVSHAPLCLIAAFVAIGLNPDFARSQEQTAAPAKEVEASKAETSAPETPVDPPKETAEKVGAEKKASDKKAEAAEKPEGAGKAAPGENAKKGDKKQEEKKPEPAEPKKLPKLGSLTGPMLPGQPWRVHDLRRPRPAMVTPGELSTYEKPGTPPSDAIVLFDGKDLSNWCHISPEDPSQLLEAQWKVENGYFEVTPRSGSLHTIDNFGTCQFHIEWQTPAEVRGDSQGRGNSGVYFMGEFEVQVLDSYNNRTYADGQAGALYGQYPPMVNASRKPGEWQVYDILFQAPKFSLDGKLERPALVTVIHNGIFLHNAREYVGQSGGGGLPKYDPISPAAPIQLQNHGNPVRFRNVWVRPLPE